mgnify:CR=1 FL=1
MGCSQGKPAGAAYQASSVPEILPNDLVLDFGRLMKNPAGREALLEFAQSEYSEENVLFYEKAQRFRKSHLTHDPNTDEEQARAMRKEASALIDEFLKDNAEQALGSLGSSNPFRKGLPENIAPAANMFDSICRAVHKSIEHDIFPRFKQSSFGSALLAKMPSLAKRLSGSSGQSTNRSTHPSEG